MMPDQAANPAITGAPRLLLRLEGFVALAGALLAFVQVEGPEILGAPWWVLAALFFAPDLSMLAYLGGPRAGALVYNAAHTYVAPFLLGSVGFYALGGAGFALALLWIAHIGFDRALGYGLKYGSGFSDTHLGRIGKPR